jgi:hypothetical protein
MLIITYLTVAMEWSDEWRGIFDAEIVHIKMRVTLGEKTTHIDKARSDKNKMPR